MARKQSKTITRQKTAAIALAIVATGIAVALTWFTFKDAPLGEFIEGEHYLVLENPRRIRTEEIEIMEFFSYACVHCFNFDPDLERWVESKGTSVNFIQMPAVANEYWRLLGRHYFTLQHLDMLDQAHTPFFTAIHDGRLTFSAPDRLAEFTSNSEVSAEDYLTAFNSAQVSAEMTKADQMARRLQVAAVPTIIVQGKYVVRTTREIGPKRMLDVMDHLISLLATEQDQPQNN